MRVRCYLVFLQVVIITYKEYHDLLIPCDSYGFSQIGTISLGEHKNSKYIEIKYMKYKGLMTFIKIIR